MLSRTEVTVNYIILSLFALVVLVPLVLLVFLALAPATSSEGLTFTSLHPSNFVSAWDTADLGRAMLNSLIYSVGTVIGTALLAVPAGYAFGTMRFPGRQVLFVILLVGVMVPLTAVIIPIYYNFLSWHLSDTYEGIIIAHVGLSISFGVFWMRSYFRSVPRSLLEAATLDGATSWSALWRIYVPMGRPAVVCFSLLVFMWTWNDYLLSLVLVISNSIEPAALALGDFQLRFTTEYSLMAAGAIIIALPILIIYLVMQRQLIAGIIHGAVKG
jgi:raffinose/stachyose/melibiose transport system permease protein